MIRTHILRGETGAVCDLPLPAAFSAGPDDVVWVDMEAPTPEEIALLSERWQFHPLAIEDCIHAQRRAKFERYATHGFLVFQALDRSTEEELDTVGVCVFLRRHLVVTVRPPTITALDHVLDALKRYPEQVGNSTDRLLHAILDASIDEFTLVMYQLEEKVDVLEALAAGMDQERLVDGLVRVRRALLHLRRIILPLREVIRRFTGEDNPDVRAEERIYFRDVLDHVDVIADTTHLLLDICNGALQVHANVVNERLNQVMKYMAIVSTLLLPMTVISGAFGMNFKLIPISDDPDGFWIAIGMMVACAGLLLGIFRYRRWF